AMLMIAGAVAGGLAGSLQRESSNKSQLNQGIRLSIRNTLYVGLYVPLLFFFAPVIVAAKIWRWRLGWDDWLPWLAGWFLLSMCIGGFDAIQHYLLRLELYLTERIPLQVGSMLNQAHDLIFMRKVGGGF